MLWRFLLVFLVVVSYGTANAKSSDEISVISLIFSPASYENRTIVVKGVAGIAEHESNLYLDDWSFKYFVGANSICLNFNAVKDYNFVHGVTIIVHGDWKKNDVCGYALDVKNVAFAPSRDNELRK